MTANPLTDQILAAADQTAARNRDRAALVRELATAIRSALPDVDEQLLGEITLHVGTAACGLVKGLDMSGWPTGLAAMYALAATTEAGAVLYRGRGNTGTPS